MNKLFKCLSTAFLGVALAVGVGVGVAQGSKSGEVSAASQTYVATSLAAGKQVLIVSHTSTTNPQYYLMDAVTAATSSGPKHITCSLASGKITGDYSAHLFTVAEDGSNWKFTNSSGKYLLLSGTNSNTAVRINTTSFSWTYNSSNKTLKHPTAGRYLGVYVGGTDWRSYNSSTATNYSGTGENIEFFEVGSVQLTSIAISGNNVTGTNPNYAITVGSSELSAKTINVALDPTNASDQKVNIAHSSGTNGIVTLGSSSTTCTSGAGSFTITGTGATSGTETFAISGNTETSVISYLTVTAIDDSKTYYDVTFDSNGGSISPEKLSVEDGQTFVFPSAGTKDHYSFTGWSNDGIVFYDEGDTSPIVTSNIGYTAYWAEDAKYNVTYTAGEHGSGTDYVVSNVYVGSYTLAPFASTGLSADEGYRFKNYTVGGVEKNPGETIDISEDTTVTVNFETKPLETTYDFVTNFATYTSTGWSTSYEDHTLNGKTDLNGEYSATINLYKASKQTSTIKTMPVFATKTESGWTKVLGFKLEENNVAISSVSVTFEQWSSQTPSVALFAGSLVSGTPISTLTIGSGSLVLSGTMNSLEFSIGYCDGSGSNIKSGLKTISVTFRQSSAVSYATTFNDAGLCDGGVTAPSTSTWSSLSTSYSSLDALDKELFVNGDADESGSAFGQCLARYDYILGKYGTTSYSNFMGRTVTPVGSASVLSTMNVDNNIVIIVVISVVSLTALGGYFFIRRRKETH